MSKLNNKDRLAILEDEVRNWEGDQYRMEVRARVYRATGQDQQLEQLTKSLEQIRIGLDSLVKERDQLKKDIEEAEANAAIDQAPAEA